MSELYDHLRTKCEQIHSNIANGPLQQQASVNVTKVIQGLRDAGTISSTQALTLFGDLHDKPSWETPSLDLYDTDDGNSYKVPQCDQSTKFLRRAPKCACDNNFKPESGKVISLAEIAEKYWPTEEPDSMATMFGM